MTKRLSRLVISLVLLAIVFFVFYFSNQATDPTVLKTEPTNSEEEVLVTSDILIRFNNELSPEQQSKIEIKISPEVEYVLLWESTVARISPKGGLNPDTQYKLRIAKEDMEIYTFSFTTSPFTQEQILEEGAIQTEYDLEFGIAFTEFLDNHPWYSSLPIENESYRIVYDYERESFRIRLFDVEEQETIDRALNDLLKIGVEEPVPYYVISPES